MQKYKQAALSIAFLTVFLSGGSSVGFVRAMENQGNNKVEVEERILESFEDGDYDTWKKIVAKKGKAYGIVSKEDFFKFIDARKAARNGNYDLAIDIANSLEKNLKEKFFEQYEV